MFLAATDRSGLPMASDLGREQFTTLVFNETMVFQNTGSEVFKKGTTAPVTPFAWASKQRSSNGNIGPLENLPYGVTDGSLRSFFARVRRFLTESRLEFNYGTAAGFSGE